MNHFNHTLATSEEGREHEVQQEKHTPGLATSDLVMSLAEVERRGGTGVNNGHDPLVGNGSCGNTSMRGEGQGTTRRGGNRARRDDAEYVGVAGDGARHGGRSGVARRGMGAPPRGGLGPADGMVIRDEQSKELRIFVSYRSVDRVDRRESAGPLGPVAKLAWERERGVQMDMPRQTPSP
jgi:hypothetical protein